MADGLGVRVAGYRQAVGGGGTEISTLPALVPWSHTDHEDSDYFSRVGGSVTIPKAGHYYAFWWSRIQSAGAAGRNLVLGELRVNGVAVDSGRSTAYIRAAGNANTGGMHGRAILNLAAGDVVTLWFARIDTGGAGNPQLVNLANGRTGISFVRFDTSFSYARYRRTTLDTASAASWASLEWTTTDEEDATAFEINALDKTQVKLKLAGHYKLTATIRCDASTFPGRSNCIARATWDGAQILSPVGDTIRRVDGCNEVILTFAGIINATSTNKYLEVEYHDLGSPFKPGATCTLEIVKLPDTGDYMRLRSDAGTQPADTDNYPITWNQQDELDAASFSHSVGTSPIGLVQSGRFLFYAQGYSERGGTDTDRLLHRLFWYKDSTSTELIRGASMSYDRGYAPPFNYHRAGSHACLLSAAGEASDVISIRHSQDAGGNADPDCDFASDGLWFQAVNLNSIMPLKAEARGLVSAHGRSLLSVIAGQNIYARGLVSAQAQAKLGSIVHAGAHGQIDAQATPILSVTRRVRARWGMVEGHGGPVTLGKTVHAGAHGGIEAQVAETTLSVIRRVGSRGLARAGARAPLSMIRGSGARGLAAAQAHAPLSVELGFGISARGLVTAQGWATLGAIRHAVARAHMAAHGAPCPLSRISGLEPRGTVSALARAPLSVVRGLRGRATVQAIGQKAALGLFEQIGIRARGLVSAHGRAVLGGIRGIEARGEPGAHAVEATVAVLRALEARALVDAQGIAEASLKTAVAIHARGLIECHARTILGRARGLEPRGHAEAQAEAALGLTRGAIARGLVSLPGALGALSVLRGLAGRGLFSLLARANPNRLLEIHARGLVEAITLKLELGDAPELGFYSETAKVCRVRIRERWSTPQSISTSYDNLPFARPPGTLHAISSVVFGPEDAEIADLSLVDDHLTATGDLEVIIRAPFADGENTGLEAADALVTAFRKITIGNVHFGTPHVTKNGLVGSFFEFVAHCPFWGEDSRARLLPISPGVDGDRDSTATALRKRVRTQVATPLGLAVQYENLPFDRPLNDEWLRTALVEGGAFEAERSGETTGTHRTAGVFYIDASVPFGIGESRLLEIVDAIDDAFRVVSVQGIELGEPTVDRGRRLGADWRRTVAIPYLADETT